MRINKQLLPNLGSGNAGLDLFPGRLWNIALLLNLRKDEFGAERRKAQRFFAILLVFLLLTGLATIIELGTLGLTSTGEISQPSAPAGPEPLAQLLYTKYLFPFELASILLLVAIVGAVVMAKRRL